MDCSTIWLLPSGSSPRVRGTAGPAGSAAPAFRFIPAGAGNGVTPLFSCTYGTVHPRGCGERFSLFRHPTPADGSSPRVRGTVSASLGSLGQLRFIPAGAGNGRRGIGRPTPKPVHPRGCGERILHLIPAFASNGSSPRVRGTGVCLLSVTGNNRFIPAGAGNGMNRAAPNAAPAVHPRGCGERLPTTVLYCNCNGSSPRVRGTVLQRLK